MSAIDVYNIHYRIENTPTFIIRVYFQLHYLKKQPKDTSPKSYLMTLYRETVIKTVSLISHQTDVV